MKKIVLAITGGSGAAYAVRLTEVLLAAGAEVHLSISPAGQLVIQQELGLAVDVKNFTHPSLLRASSGMDTRGTLHYYHYTDMMAPIASGSFLTDGMVVCPCSGSTLGSIAHSMGNNLIHRAAEVHLKERRKLILVPRETPLSLPQITNMKLATESGAIVLPAAPGFYHGATTISDLVDFIVARICDQLGIEHRLMKRWGSGESSTSAP